MSATAKAFLYGLNFGHFVPNLQNKHLERWITATKQHLPDYSLALRLAVNSTAGQNTCCVLNNCRTSVTGNR